MTKIITDGPGRRMMGENREIRHTRVAARFERAIGGV